MSTRCCRRVIEDLVILVDFILQIAQHSFKMYAVTFARLYFCSKSLKSFTHCHKWTSSHKQKVAMLVFKSVCMGYPQHRQVNGVFFYSSFFKLFFFPNNSLMALCVLYIYSSFLFNFIIQL